MAKYLYMSLLLSAKFHKSDEWFIIVNETIKKLIFEFVYKLK